METTDEKYNCELQKAAVMLKQAEKVSILIHVSPDGDAIGCSAALKLALERLGKKASVLCSDKIPEKYSFLPLKNEIKQESQEEHGDAFVVAVDLADEKLFGEKLQAYAGKVQLCFDHHSSNTHYADFTVLDPKAAAACEIIADLMKFLNVVIDKDIANCIYTGLATDTGCFRYSCTRPKTLRMAADLIEKGADFSFINKLLFETNTRARLELEKRAMETLHYYFNGHVAVIVITLETLRAAGADESELEGVASMPIRIKDVLVGITAKEKEPGVYKISVRTTGGVDASAICSELGGGGHKAAAGCKMEGTLEQVRDAILVSVGKAL